MNFCFIWNTSIIDEDEKKEVESNIENEAENSYLQFEMSASDPKVSIHHDHASNSLVGIIVSSNAVDMTVIYSLVGNKVATYTKAS